MVIIKSHAHEYKAELFEDLSAGLDSIQKANNIFYLIDRKVYEYYKNILQDLPSDRVIQIDATEKQKSFEALTPLFLTLLDLGLKRDSLLFVIGGGITQDIGCFIASVMMRGIRWEFIPTTLLAQADSCIGSKSSINIGSYKNMLGTFYPPHRILIIPSLLTSLSAEDFCSGLGEVIKFQLLAGGSGYSELMSEINNIKRKPDIIKKWIQRSLEIKKAYIEHDEFDQGERNLLNYGHTFGHAYESATNYKIPHGVAVIMGILTASLLSVRLRKISQEYFNQLKHELIPFCNAYLPELQKVENSMILNAIKRDKKNTAAGINCILTSGLGKMNKVLVSLDDIAPTVVSFISDNCILN